MTDLGTKALGAWTGFADFVRLMRREFGESLRETGISLTEFRILRVLSEEGSKPMAHLADELMITRAGVTLLVDGLEGKGLVRRTRRKEDRRKIFVSTTAAGQRKMEVAGKEHDALIEDRLGRLNGRELEELTRIVEKLSGTIPADQKKQQTR